MTAFRDVFFAAPDGLRLHARDYGSVSAAVPALCLAGLTRNARDFDRLAPRLSPGRRVIVAEQRGRGLSEHDPIPANYQPPVYVRDMMALLDHLAIPRVIVIGTSLGGLMAMMMAAGWPDRIAAVLLNDVGPEIAPEGLAKIRGYIDRAAGIADWREAAEDLRSLFGAAFPRYGAPDWDRFARALYRENAAGVPVLDYDRNIAINVKSGGSAAPDLWPIFDAIPPIPLAVIHGGLSNILTAATLAEMRKRRPALATLELPDVGHAPDLDEPESQIFIERFLARADEAGRKKSWFLRMRATLRSLLGGRR